MNDLEQRFPGLRRPASDFKAVRSELQTGILMYELDLSIARSIAAGTAERTKIAGNSIYVDKNIDVGVATVIFQDDSNLKPARVFVQPGFIARVPWTQLTIENAAQPGKLLRFFYGVDQDFQPGTSNEITGNIGLLQTTASVPQGADLIVSNGNAFAGRNDMPAPGAGVSPVQQLLNPAASGKVIYVDKVSATATAGGPAYMLFGQHDTALATDLTAEFNKLSGGAAGSAQMRREGLAAVPGNTLMSRRILGASGDVVFEPKPPLRLGATRGAYVMFPIANNPLEVTWEWREY